MGNENKGYKSAATDSAESAGKGAAFFTYFNRTDFSLLKSNISILTTTAI